MADKIPFSCLEGLPIDGMRELGRFLTGQNILLLCCTGSRRLRELLFSSIEVAIILCNKQTNSLGWPRELVHFKKLRQLTFDTCYADASLHYVATVDDLMQIPPSVRSLRLLCHGIESSFSNHIPKRLNLPGYDRTPDELLVCQSLDDGAEPDQLEVAKQWPNLETLKLTSWEFYWTPAATLPTEQLTSLPSCLRELKLDEYESKDHQLIGLLPQGLEYLNLPRCLFAPLDFKGCLPALSYLCCKLSPGADNRDYESLPRTLTRLNITITGAEVSSNILEFFPPNLLELRLFPSITSSAFKFLNFLPTATHLRQLRILLTHLNLPSNLIQAQLQELLKPFPHLIYLDFYYEWTSRKLWQQFKREPPQISQTCLVLDQEWVGSDHVDKSIIHLARLHCQKIVSTSNH